MNTPEERFAALGLVLPPAPKPLGVYKPGLQVGEFYYVSGHGPVLPDASLIIGRIGADMDIEAGKLAAQQVGLTILATLKAQLGSLNRVKRVIKVLGMVNATIPNTFITRFTRFNEPNCAFKVAKMVRPTCWAASFPASMSISAPIRPIIKDASGSTGPWPET